jgi:hypothetical protein
LETDRTLIEERINDTASNGAARMKEFNFGNWAELKILWNDKSVSIPIKSLFVDLLSRDMKREQEEKMEKRKLFENH